MLRTLQDALRCFEETLARHPERDGLAAERAAVEGRARPWPCLYLNHLAAPCISVGEALAAIGRRPVVLSIGQELPADFGQAFELVRADLGLARDNPRLLFSYTGMDWRRKDRPAIRNLHRRLDDCWPKAVVGAEGVHRAQWG